jgi:hypothetical protein
MGCATALSEGRDFTSGLAARSLAAGLVGIGSGTSFFVTGTLVSDTRFSRGGTAPAVFARASSAFSCSFSRFRRVTSSEEGCGLVAG